MNCWKIYKLSEVCQVDKSQGIHKGLPYVGMEDVEAHTGNFLGSYEPQTVKSSTFKFNTGHVLYGRLRPYLNKVLVADFSGHCSTEIFPLKPSTHLHKRFLFYWLTMANTVEQINRTCTGARMPRANMKEVMEFDIPLPPLPEQKRIVAILDEAFAGIDAAVANTEKNLANGRELFESYLNGVFSRKGEGWVEKTLGDVCVFHGGSQPPKSEFSYDLKDGYIRFIQIRDYKSDKHVVYIPTEKARRFCSADDVMIGRYGPPLFQILRGIDGAYNVALMKAIPKEEFISKDYLYWFLRNGSILQYIINASNRAAGQIGLNKATLEPYPIAFPDKTKQTEIVMFLKDFYIDVQHLETIYQQKLAALAELKQSILQKAFAGELTAQPDKALAEAVA